MPTARKSAKKSTTSPSNQPPKRKAGTSNPLNVYKVETLRTFFAADLRTVLSQFREPPSAKALLTAYNQFKGSKVSQATFRSWLEVIGFEYKRTTTLVRVGGTSTPTPSTLPPPVLGDLVEGDDEDEDGSSVVIPDPIDEAGEGFDTPPRMGGGNFEEGQEPNPVLQIAV